jgi:hypothetical protein
MPHYIYKQQWLIDWASLHMDGGHIKELCK